MTKKLYLRDSLKTHFIYMDKKIFKIQLYNRELTLGETVFAERFDAFEHVFKEDAMRINSLAFTDGKSSELFVHEYMWLPLGGITNIKLGYLREIDVLEPFWDDTKETNYPHCVVLISLRNYNPYIAISNYDQAFKTADKVAEILVHTLDRALKRYGVGIKISPNKDKKGEEWADFMVAEYLDAKLYQHHKIERLENYGKPKERRGLETIVIDYRKADIVIEKIRELMKGKTEPRDFMMPLTAAVKATVINEPTYGEFKRWFPEYSLSSTSYYRLIATDNKTFQKKRSFKKMVKLFEAL